MDANHIASVINETPHPSQIRAWKKLKIGSGNVRCPRCQKDLGCVYRDLQPIAKDGGSRQCKHCKLWFHWCAAGRFGFGVPLTCKRCQAKKTKAQKYRTQRRKTLTTRFQHFAMRASADMAVRRRLIALMEETLKEYYEGAGEEVDGEELNEDCDEALAEFLEQMKTLKLKNN